MKIDFHTHGKLAKKLPFSKEYTDWLFGGVMPMVVLVNGESASASEITSGSLQDLDRAVILGTRTYGKGLVQASVELTDNGRLKLTTRPPLDAG